MALKRLHSHPHLPQPTPNTHTHTHTPLQTWRAVWAGNARNATKPTHSPPAGGLADGVRGEAEKQAGAEQIVALRRRGL